MPAWLTVNHIKRRIEIFVFSEWSTFVMLTLGCAVYTSGVVLFTLPYHFPDSGVMGVAVLLKYAFGFSPSIVTLIANTALLVWGGRELSKRFVAWTIYSVMLIAFLLELLPHILQFPRISDMVLVAIAGGIVKGIGGGMIFRTGTSAGGTDIIISVLRKKFGVEVGKYSFYLNMVILAASTGIVGVDKMLYGIISCFISGQTTDSVLSSFDRRRLVFIVVEQTNEVVDYIRDELHRGSTVLFGEGGYTGEGRCTIMSLLTARQAMVLKRHLARQYPNAFMVVSEASEVVGNGFKRWKSV